MHTLQVARGGETVLVVDDDGPVREIVAEMLRTLGYRVLEAAGPEQAQVLAAQHSETIHLLLTDVRMPGMHGRQLATTLGAVRPGLRTVLMSGEAGSGNGSPGGVVLLDKPFTIQRLASTVRRVLEDGAP